MHHSLTAKSLSQLLVLYTVRRQILRIRIATVQHEVNLAHDLLYRRSAEARRYSAELQAAYSLCREALNRSPGCIENYRSAVGRARVHQQSGGAHMAHAELHLKAVEERCTCIRKELLRLELRIETVRLKLKVIRLKALELQDAPSTE